MCKATSLASKAIVNRRHCKMFQKPWTRLILLLGFLRVIAAVHDEDKPVALRNTFEKKRQDLIPYPRVGRSLDNDVIPDVVSTGSALGTGFEEQSLKNKPFQSYKHRSKSLSVVDNDSNMADIEVQALSSGDFLSMSNPSFSSSKEFDLPRSKSEAFKIKSNNGNDVGKEKPKSTHSKILDKINEVDDVVTEPAVPSYIASAFMLPYPRPGRSDTSSIIADPLHAGLDDNINDPLVIFEQSKSSNLKRHLVPYPRVGRSAEFDFDGELNQAEDKRDSSSQMLLPYPRLGRSQKMDQYDANDETYAKLQEFFLEDRDFMIPYPRVGKRATDNQILLPYPRLGRSQKSNENYQTDGINGKYADLSKSSIYMTPYPRVGRSLSNEVLLPYPRIGRSQTSNDKYETGDNDVKYAVDLSKSWIYMTPYPRVGRSLNNQGLLPYPGLGKSQDVDQLSKHSENYARLLGYLSTNSNLLKSYPRIVKRTSDGTILPYPRLGRNQDKEQISENIDYYTKMIEMYRNNSEFLLPYPRIGRSLSNDQLLLSYPKTGQAQIGNQNFDHEFEEKSKEYLYDEPSFLMPYSRVGKTVSNNEILLPYPRLGRSKSVGKSGSESEFQTFQKLLELLSENKDLQNSFHKVGIVENYDQLEGRPSLQKPEVLRNPNTRILVNIANKNTKQEKRNDNNPDNKFVVPSNQMLLPYPRLGRSYTNQILLPYPRVGKSESNQIMLPYPRVGRSGNNQIMIPYPRVGRSENNQIMLPYPRVGKSESNQILLPYPRLGRTEIQQQTLLPYPRLGRSGNSDDSPNNHSYTLDFNNNGNIQETIIPYPRLGRSDGDQDNTITETESTDSPSNAQIYIIPYPRLGRSDGDQDNTIAETESTDSPSDTQIHIIPYPRLGRSKRNITNNEMEQNIKKFLESLGGKPNYMLPYPRPGRSSVLPIIDTKKSEFLRGQTSIISNPRFGRSDDTNVGHAHADFLQNLDRSKLTDRLYMLPYPRIGKSTTSHL